jgi:hypothetical protein
MAVVATNVKPPTDVVFMSMLERTVLTIKHKVRETGDKNVLMVYGVKVSFTQNRD